MIIFTIVEESPLINEDSKVFVTSAFESKVFRRKHTELGEMMIRIDDTDREILKALRYNARITFAELGRQVNLTAPAVAGRIQRLEKLGIIKGYQAQVNEGALSGQFMIIIRIAVESRMEKRFLKFVGGCQFVSECCRTSGQENFMLKVAMPSTQALNKLVGDLNFYGKPVTSLVIDEVRSAFEENMNVFR
ncbi:MAG: Lrp/AsnC family transcriptional regulator [Chloroflexota bacterium]